MNQPPNLEQRVKALEDRLQSSDLFSPNFYRRYFTVIGYVLLFWLLLVVLGLVCRFTLGA